MAEQHSPHFDRAIARFDAANSADPTVRAGQPQALAYGQRMTAWLQRLYPQAGEALQLAARSQHICRWMIPRDTYPKTRAGYHLWRTALYGFHARTASQILQEVGYDPATIARVQSLLQKQKLRTDPQMQALEDVACMVFLEDQFSDFAERHDEEKMLTILRRTWAKMTDKAHEAALSLDLPPKAKLLVTKALSKS
jgi:hypothetical protein